jgi:hypothetical protein
VEYFNGFIQFTACGTGDLFIFEASSLPLFKKLNEVKNYNILGLLAELLSNPGLSA